MVMVKMGKTLSLTRTFLKVFASSRQNSLLSFNKLMEHLSICVRTAATG